MLKAGKKGTEIAQVIGCHRATIYREIERGTINGGYSASYAQSTINMPKNAK
jgi:IS30 family transposase